MPITMAELIVRLKKKQKANKKIRISKKERLLDRFDAVFDAIGRGTKHGGCH